MKPVCLAALAAMMMTAAPLAAQNPKATPLPLSMATSVSLDVRQVAARKQVNDAFDSRGVGSYDKSFSRERVIEISLRTSAKTDQEVIARTWFIGKGAISTTNARHLLRQSERRMKLGSAATKWEESSGLVRAEDMHLKSIEYRSYSGSRIDGWIVTIHDVTDTTLLAVKASDHPLTILARTPGELAALPRR